MFGGIFISWLVFCFIVGQLGKNRKIGFGAAFFISLILSPLIGLLVVLFSAEEKDVFQSKVSIDTLDLTRKEETQPIPAIQPAVVVASVADELKKLHELKESGIITTEEFETQKNKLLS